MKKNIKTHQLEQWQPGEDTDNINDIEIVVFKDKEMTEERRYEDEYRWENDWIQKYEFHQVAAEPSEKDKNKYDSWKRYQKFCADWPKWKAKAKIPKWYAFDPADPFSFQENPNHNSLRNMDKAMFHFLKKQRWEMQDSGQTLEKSEFIVDCSQLLGIGGEAVVIRKAVAEKVIATKIETEKNNIEFEALKIIPMMKHNFESKDRFDEIEKRVNDRQELDIEKERNEFMNQQRRLLQQSDSQQRMG